MVSTGVLIYINQSREAYEYATISPRENEQIMSRGEREQDKVAILSDLIKRGREGDTQAMEAIYEQYKRPLFNLIYRFTNNFHTAEDLLQETFLKIFSHLQDVEKVELFKHWLYRIAVNTCYSYLRGTRVKHRKTVSLSEIEGRLEEKTNKSQDREMRSSLDEAIKSLAPKLKCVFLLHDVQGFKHEEIAQMFGWSVGTSKSQLFKARMRIKNYFENN